MKDREIRKKFRDYFESLEHQWHDSISLLPDDPSMLFTTAGMVQFKKHLLGDPGRVKRAASIQKCLRTTDIDEVGKTSRHLTFFEMYGNFSFGDYFKKEAVKWGWDFLSEQIGLSPENLHATVYEDDDEAFGIWKEHLPAERIHRLGEEDNFWKMGDTGPCGPCSEVLYDRGEETGCGRAECAPGCDCDRYMEVWNFVFTQFDRQSDGTLKELPKKNIDTGMGLERLNQVVNGLDSVYETETLSPLMDKARREADNFNLSSARILSDHARAAAFLICDGVSPTNEGRGYVLRRLIRRAVKEGRKLGGDFALWEYASLAVDIFAEYYPEILERARHIAMVIKSEEESFLGALAAAERILEGYVEEMKNSGDETLDAEKVFKLYDTHGMPADITASILEEKGYGADIEGFERLLAEASESTDWKEKSEADSFWNEVKDLEKTLFTGYGEYSGEAKVLKVAGGGRGIVLDKTPLYAESGGQAGDRGVIRGENGKFRVLNTIKEEDIFIHTGKLEGDIPAGSRVTVEVDISARRAAERNHTATHILQTALRELLGTHIQQNGSYVGPERLRFDYTHMEPLTGEQIKAVEERVNSYIMKNLPVEASEMDREEAKEKGALAFFGEKYGKKVRAVSVIGNEPGEPVSMELCGGTHLRNTGEAGLFKILSESGIAAGVRRIEAVTGEGALEYINRKLEILSETASLLRTPQDNLPDKISKLLGEIKEKKQKISDLENKLASGGGSSEKTVRAAGAELVIREFDSAGPGVMRGWADSQASSGGRAALACGRSSSGAMIILKLSPDLAEKYDAGRIVSRAAEKLGGSGGGRKDMAQGGGPETEGLGAARDSVISAFNENN